MWSCTIKSRRARILRSVLLASVGIGAFSAQANAQLKLGGMLAADGVTTIQWTIDYFGIPNSCTVTVTNGASVAPYVTNYQNSPPNASSASLTVPGSAFIGPPNGPTYAFFLVQAPDILKPGPGGSYPNYTQPVQWNYQCDGGAMNSVLIALAPPPVLLVHGLWGSSTSLAITQEYLYGIAPYSGLSADFIYPVAYENDAAFDSSEVAGDVQLDINMATTRLMNDGLMFGRWDVIAHSMGGLVARHYSATSSYNGPSNRTVGAFHQIITLNTPEIGSQLATFLFDNAAVQLSPNARTVAMYLAGKFCGTATTIQTCLANNSMNFAPAGQPLTAGAIYALEPGSTNLTGLPAPSIPNVYWRAGSSTVSQADSLSQEPNALVYALDELIAATCPGPSYCPTSATKPPRVGDSDILGTKTNDGIVTLASQKNQSYDYATFSDLAHTSVFNGAWTQYFPKAVTGNVLDDPGVNSMVGCWLIQSTCPQARPPIVEVAAEPPGKLRYDDIPAYWRELDRFSHKVPATAAQGDVIKIRIRFPFDKITSIQARESGGADSYEGNVGADVPAHLEPTPDGQAYEVVPVLSQGKIHFSLGAIFKDRATSAAYFDVQVGPPEAPPATFYADRSPQDSRAPAARLGLGGFLELRPHAVFATAPKIAVWMKRGVSFRVQPAEGEPVVSVDDAGKVTALRTGRATVEAVLGNYTAPFVVDVFDPATQPALRCVSGHFPIDPNEPHGEIKARYQYCVPNH